MAGNIELQAEIDLLRAQLDQAQTMLEAEVRQRIALESQLKDCEDRLAIVTRE